MHCARCNHHISECTCPDINERLAGIGGKNTHTAAKFCRKCGNHYARCQCLEPDFYIKIDGQELPMSVLDPKNDTLEVQGDFNQTELKTLNEVIPNLRRNPND